MPAKRKLPRNAKRLPKGTVKADYEPSVIREYERDKNRQYKEVHRKKQRRMGIQDVTFSLGLDARLKLERLRRKHGGSKAQLLTKLIVEAPE